MKWEIYQLLKKYDEVREEISAVLDDLEQYMSLLDYLELKAKIDDLEKETLMLKRISKHYL